MLISFYRLAVGLVFWLCFPVLLTVVLITGRQRSGLAERLTCYRRVPAGSGRPRIWMHAASIGEVAAARLLMEEVRRRVPDSDFVLTTMTVHGRDFARALLPPEMVVRLAPLDVPPLVGRAVHLLRPSLYVCLETELWPLLLAAVKRSGAAAVLLNGRISDRSSRNYLRLRRLFAPVVQHYDRIAVISEKDRRRFIALGVNPERVVVSGNIKNDHLLPADKVAIREQWRRLLGVEADRDVFIAGSTHAPEEQYLLPLIRHLVSRDLLVLLAPRHLQRVDEVVALCRRQHLDCDLLSRIKAEGGRRHHLVVVDTMGDLAGLYSVAAIAFIGGSLVNYGGHNVMEAARWGAVVFHGPNTSDFQDAVEALAAAGGGIRVGSVEDLAGGVGRLLDDRQELARRRRQATAAAGQLGGAIQVQAELIVRALAARNT